jgi:hypothetical protein
VWFASDRAGGYGYTDIYKATRPTTVSPWGAPVRENALNSAYHDERPCVSPDELTMWYTSDDYPASGGGWDIRVSTRTDKALPWDGRTNVSELKVSREEYDPWVSSDGLTMYYSSDRSGGVGGHDIWKAERPSTTSPWSTFANPTEVNSTSTENHAWVGADGLTTWFSSDRSGGLGGFDIWKADRAQMPPMDLSGNPLDGDGNGTPGPDFVCEFTLDTTPPVVVSTSPASGATTMDVRTNVTITFSEEMDEAALTTAFSVAPSVAGDLSLAGNVLTFDPLSDLPNATTYTVTVDTGAVDLAGLPLAADHVFTFTVNDSVAPYVTSTSPVNGAVDVPLSSSITVTFSELMDAAATEGAFSTDPALGGAPSVSGATLTLVPSGGLESDTEYTVTISTAAADLVGLTLAADYTFTFSTEDLTAPAAVTEVDAIAASDEIELRWRNPYEVDFAGVVILRSVDAAPTGAPARGATYSVGNVIANAVVVYVGAGATGIPGDRSGWVNTGLENGREHHYAIFAHDEEMNYSSGATASGTPTDDGGEDGLCGVGAASPAWLAAFAALVTLAFARFRGARWPRRSAGAPERRSRARNPASRASPTRAG